MLRTKIEYGEGYLAKPFGGNSGRRKDLYPIGGPGNFRGASPPARLTEFREPSVVATPTVMMHPQRSKLKPPVWVGEDGRRYFPCKAERLAAATSAALLRSAETSAATATALRFRTRLAHI